MTISDHWLAVQRDVIALGYDPDDILTEVLPFRKMLAIVVPSPPGTAVRWALDKGVTIDGQVVADLARTQSSGLAVQQAQAAQQPIQGGSGGGLIPAPMQGGANRAVDIDAMRRQRGPVANKVTGFDSMSIEEWERIKAENWARPAQAKTKRAV